MDIKERDVNIARQDQFNKEFSEYRAQIYYFEHLNVNKDEIL